MIMPKTAEKQTTKDIVDSQTSGESKFARFGVIMNRVGRIAMTGIFGAFGGAVLGLFAILVLYYPLQLPKVIEFLQGTIVGFPTGRDLVIYVTMALAGLGLIISLVIGTINQFSADAKRPPSFHKQSEGSRSHSLSAVNISAKNSGQQNREEGLGKGLKHFPGHKSGK